MTTNHETTRIAPSAAGVSRFLGLSLTVLASGALAQEPTPAPATTVIEVPLQQVTRLHNSQPNVLEGIGLVVGLNGTGAGDVASRLAVSNFVRTHGNNVNPSELVGGSAALVQLRAILPPFSQEGMTFDVTAASLGDATSLGGGMLVQAELRGVDGEVFALASGPLVIGGFAAGGKQAKVSRNHPTVGVVPKGASVVRELKSYYLSEARHLELLLINPHETTAISIAARIHEALRGQGCKATALSRSLVRIELPEAMQKETIAVDLLAKIGSLKVRVHNPATVVINEATGMVLAGEGVMISPCTVTLEDLTISVVQQDEVVQPLPGINGGVTAIVPRTQIDITTRKSELKPVRGGSTVNELLENLKALELEPRQMITVFQKLADNGYLHAELKVN
jgi:flagellar P-ring protein precursor FlgI